jgi:hypothetical protein
MVTGRFKGYIRAIDRYLLYCKSRSRWLTDTGFLFNIGVVALFLFNIIDVVETHYSVAIDGRFSEANCLVAPFVDNFILFLFVKILMITIALSILNFIKRYSGVYLASLMLYMLVGYSLDVIVRNLVLIMGVSSI